MWASVPTGRPAVAPAGAGRQAHPGAVGCIPSPHRCAGPALTAPAFARPRLLGDEFPLSDTHWPRPVTLCLVTSRRFPRTQPFAVTFCWFLLSMLSLGTYSYRSIFSYFITFPVSPITFNSSSHLEFVLVCASGKRKPFIFQQHLCTSYPF